MAQARVLTPLQASQINAGRGEELLHGPYVISHALASPHFATCYRARHIETAQTVRLYVARCSQVSSATSTRRNLNSSPTS